MKWLVLLAAVPSFVVAALAVPFVRKIALRTSLVDRPSADRFHRDVTPLGGGIAIWLAAVVVLATATVSAIWWPGGGSTSNSTDSFWVQVSMDFIGRHAPGVVHQAGRLWSLLTLASAMAAIGLIDDKWRLGWPIKLASQIIIAVITVAMGWRLTLFIDATSITFGLSVLWIVAVTNAFNLLDNMDGLAAGVAVIVAILLAVVMLMAPDPLTHQPQLFVAGLLAVVAGSAGGFLLCNWHPATIFMGDAGSQLLGYLLATTTMMATYAGGDLPDHAVFAPLCVLAVPIYDTLSVVALRLASGKNLFSGDTRHFSHRLVGQGMSVRQSVCTIYLLTLTCGLGALLLHQVDRFGAAIVVTMVACVLVVIATLESAARMRQDL